MKRVIIILGFIVLVTGCGCNDKKTEDFETNHVNLNDGVIEDKVLDNFKTTNTSVIYEHGITTFKTELEAINETYVKQIKVIFKSKSGNTIIELVGYIDQTISSRYNVLITSDVDLSNAYSIEYIFE